MEKENSKIKERILQIPEKLNISKAEFFRNSGVKYTSFKGTSLKSELNTDSLEKIYSNYNQINLEWILTGEGEMLKNDESLEQLNETPLGYLNLKDKKIQELEKKLTEQESYIEELRNDKKVLQEALREITNLKKEHRGMLPKPLSTKM